MKFPVLAACVALASVFATATAPARSPGCDKCSDLPQLYRELLEQEFLRNLFDSWIRQSYYPGTVSTMQKTAQAQLNAAIKGGVYGSLAPDKVGAGEGGAAPAYGTDLTSKACQLVEYYKDENGDDQQRPTTPEEVRAKHCGPIADFVLAHEGHHKDTCKASWAASKSDKFVTVEYVAKDDHEAYQTGIGVLRKHIAKLAKDCGWSGSTNARRPDGTMTVPTPEQILKLKDAARKNAALLGRKTK